MSLSYRIRSVANRVALEDDLCKDVMVGILNKFAEDAAKLEERSETSGKGRRGRRAYRGVRRLRLSGGRKKSSRLSKKW